jgi:hypothetical protein
VLWTLQSVGCRTSDLLLHRDFLVFWVMWSSLGWAQLLQECFCSNILHTLPQTEGLLPLKDLNTCWGPWPKSGRWQERMGGHESVEGPNAQAHSHHGPIFLFTPHPHHGPVMTFQANSMPQHIQHLALHHIWAKGVPFPEGRIKLTHRTQTLMLHRFLCS